MPWRADFNACGADHEPARREMLKKVTTVREAEGKDATARFAVIGVSDLHESEGERREERGRRFAPCGRLGCPCLLLEIAGGIRRKSRQLESAKFD
jgi:hypothetical protein